MNQAELRLLARRLSVCGYAGLSRERLTARILKRLKRYRRWEDWLPQEL
jgi:hypothetical protein